MDNLGPQEKAILAMIVANPFTGQQDMATTLGLARSTVAAHVVQLVNKGYILGRGYLLPAPQRMICIGGAVLDRKYHTQGPLNFETSNPVCGHCSFGGVARNVAENLARLGVDVSFISIVGDDDNGRSLVRQLRDLGVDVSQIIVTTERPTAEYVAILGPGNELILGVDDMAIFELFKSTYLDRFWPHLASANWVFCDCNLPATTIESLISRKDGARYKLAVDTISSSKALRLPRDLTGIDLLFSRSEGANAILGHLDSATRIPAEDAAVALRERGAAEVIVTKGITGYAVATAHGVTQKPFAAAKTVDSIGASDAMVAGTLYEILNGEDTGQAARSGAALATLTMESDFSVHPDLSPRFLAVGRHRIAG